MAVKQRVLKISHASVVVDKNATIDTVKRASRDTEKRADNFKKDVRAAMKNSNSNNKLAEDRKKGAIFHVQTCSVSQRRAVGFKRKSELSSGGGRKYLRIETVC